MQKLREVVDWLYNLWVQRLSDKEVQDKYAEAGAEFGDADSYSVCGEVAGLEAMLLNLVKWELEYSRRGYRTISINDFIDYGGYGRLYGKSLKGLGIKREINEKIVLHADIYRKRCFKKTKPVIDIVEIFKTGKAQSGTRIIKHKDK